MATVTQTTVPAFAHCRDSRCAGNAQQPVQALRHTSEWSYVDNGGNMPGVERSTVTLAFADEATHAACPTCGVGRELSEQTRPEYTPLSGHRQDGLLHVKSFDASKQPSGDNAVIAELMKQVSQLSAQVAGQDAKPAPSGFVAAAKAEGAAIEDDLRQQEIKQRRLDALAKARAAKVQKAQEETGA